MIKIVSIIHISYDTAQKLEHKRDYRQSSFPWKVVLFGKFYLLICAQNCVNFCYIKSSF